MNCEEATRLVDGYLDRELDALTNQTIERHLRDCHNCERIYSEHRTFVGSIHNLAPYYKAPAELRRRIQSSLREMIAEEPAPAQREIEPPIRQAERRSIVVEMPRPWGWLALAATIALAAIIVWNFVPRVVHRESDAFLATQLIASHARSLMANHLTDVPSTDQHTVKPWLDARLDFAAPVADLANEGFPLVGGRLDYLDNHAVAALIYQRRKHFINLFIWPAGQGTPDTRKRLARQGYHLLHWVDPDFNYWVVSDIGASELETFKQLFEKQIAPR